MVEVSSDGHHKRGALASILHAGRFRVWWVFSGAVTFGVPMGGDPYRGHPSGAKELGDRWAVHYWRQRPGRKVSNTNSILSQKNSTGNVTSALLMNCQ